MLASWNPAPASLLFEHLHTWVGQYMAMILLAGKSKKKKKSMLKIWKPKFQTVYWRALEVVHVGKKWKWYQGLQLLGKQFLWIQNAWGKRNVLFDQQREDSVTCSHFPKWWEVLRQCCLNLVPFGGKTQMTDHFGIFAFFTDIRPETKSS